MFSERYPEQSKAFRVVKGIHGLHLYATEYWTEYLLSEARRAGGIGSESNSVFRLAQQLADKLETVAPSSPHHNDSDPGVSEERLLLLGQHEALQKHVKRSLKSITIEQFERQLLKEQGDWEAFRNGYAHGLN